MKKGKLLLMLTLCAAMLLLLTACGKSPAVKETEELIKAIGEVTVDSKETVEKAENAYAALSAEEQKAVGNYTVLTAARETLDAVQLEQLKQDILGTWSIEGDLSDMLNESINASFTAEMPEFMVDSFPVLVRYTFRDDGTYEAEMDAEKLQSSMGYLLDTLTSWLDDIFLRALADSFRQQGLTGDFSTWSAVEAAAEMTKAEIYREMLGMDLEEFVDAISRSISLDQLGQMSKGVGKYDLDLGKLYMNEDPAKELAKTDYTRIAVNGNTMTWLSYVGNGEAPFFYPAVFNRVR